MRKSLLVAALLLAGPARADLSWRWDRTDVALEASFAAITAVDWMQTLDFTQSGRFPHLSEANPLLGKHPSRGAVNAYMPLAMLGHAAVAAALPRGVFRSAWQMTWIALETQVIVHNRFNGIGLMLPW